MKIKRVLAGLTVLATIAAWPAKETAAQTFEGITAEVQEAPPPPPLPQPGQPRGGQKPAPTVQPPGQSQAAPLGSIGTRNIQVDVTIQSQGEGGPPVSKVVTMLVADGSMANIRVEQQAGRRVNSDVRASIRDAKITLGLNLDVDIATDPSSKASLQYRGGVNVILDSGVATIVSRAPDPTSGRSITVEVKATVLK